MNRKIVFIADYYSDEILGGGELNNEVLYSLLVDDGFSVEKIKSSNVTKSFIEARKDNFFIVFNFVLLSQDCKAALKNKQYIIYEHDHKYIKSRNPAVYRDFKAPPQSIINYQFYKSAQRVFCQTNFHREIVELNLDLENIESLGGNLWSTGVLDRLRAMSVTPKRNTAVMDSPIRHKNTAGAVKYCEQNGIKYDLVRDGDYLNFLKKLSSYDHLVFLPQTPETLSRIVVEARMLGLRVATNDLVGATKEPWFKLKGPELIDYMVQKRAEILNKIKEEIKKEAHALITPDISILTTFYEAEDHLEGLLEDITQQTIFDKCEFIIVDTASPGKEREMLAPYLKKYSNIKYYRFDQRLTANEGTNIALRMSRGRYVTIANIDDRRHPEFLEQSFNVLEDNTEASLVYSDCYVTDQPNVPFLKHHKGHGTEANLFDHSLNDFSKENMIKCLPGPMPFWRRTINEECGFFSEKYEYANDWALWLEAVDNGFKFIKNKNTLGLYVLGGKSTQNTTEQRKEEAKLFFKYSHLFGYNNVNRYREYFSQFI